MGKGLLRDAAAGLALLVVLAALPAATGAPALRDFLIYVIAYGLLAMSLNMLVGLTGLVSFGHAVFFASGAYAFGLLMQSGHTSIPVAFGLAVGGSALLALVIGAIALRLKGIYFSFVTLALQMFVYSVILTWVGLTGGDQGLQGGIPRPPFLGLDLGDGETLYLASVAVFAVCLAVMRQVGESPFGYTLRLIRDNPARAGFLGVDVFRAQLLVFVLAGALASVGGVVLALFVSGAYPDFGYWTTSGEAIFILMLGGTGAFLGPLVGTVILQTLNHYVTIATEYHNLVLGLVILAIVLGLRRGVTDTLATLWGGRRRPAPAPRAAAPAEMPAPADGREVA